VFFFTALGHFAKPEEMMHMLPAGGGRTMRYVHTSTNMKRWRMAIDEGLRSLKEEPTITFEELDRRISEKFGWK
jgi:hypothetical protein